MSDPDPRDLPPWPAQSAAGWSLTEPAAPVEVAPTGPRYVRSGQIGRGGMGVVYAAWDRQLGREVAIKEADPQGGADALARLEREARLTAGLDHPGIVPVHDVGVGEDGRIFYAMRLVRGQPLSERVANTPSLAGRLSLVRPLLDAAQAIAHAHAHGVVHRDLKPANLVTGDLGETQVIDWGLARAIGEAGGGGGTPGYARPAQLAGGAADPRDDVYGLGAALLEILHGAPPRSTEPPADAPPELAAIARRALAEQGYPDARALAVDLADWLDGRPVHAHRYTPLELAVRFVRAWRVPLAVAALAAVLLLTIAGAAWRRTAEARDRAEDAETVARSALDQERARSATLLAARAGEALRDARWAEAGVLAGGALELRELPEARGVLAAVMGAGRWPVPTQDTPAPCPDPLGLSAQGEVLCWTDDAVVVHGASGARRLIGVQAQARNLTDDHLGLVQANTDLLQILPLDGAPPWTAQVHEPSNITLDYALGQPRAGLLQVQRRDGAPDLHQEVCPGSTISVTRAEPVHGPPTRFWSACDDGAVYHGALGGPITRVQTRLAEGAQHPVGLERLPGQDAVVLTSVSGALSVLDLATGLTRYTRDTDLTMPSRLRVSPNGRLIAAWGDQPQVAVLRADTGQIIARLRAPGLRDALFLDDERLVVLGERRIERRFPGDLPAAELVAPAGLSGAAISPDGRRIAGGMGDGAVRIWSLPDGATLAQRKVSEGVVKATTWLDPLRLVAAHAGSGPHALIELDTTGSVLPPTHSVAGTTRARRIVVLDGALLSASYNGGLTRAVDGREEPVAGCEGLMLHDLDVSPDGRAALGLGEGRRLARVSGAPPRCEVIQPGAAISAVAITSDGRMLLGSDEGGRDLRVEPDQGRVWVPGGPYDLETSSDGRWLAAGGRDGTVRVWDLERGALVSTLRAHRERVAGLAFSPDGAALYSASWDARLRRHALEGLLATPAQIRAWEAGWGLTLDELLAEDAGR